MDIIVAPSAPVVNSVGIYNGQYTILPDLAAIDRAGLGTRTAEQYKRAVQKYVDSGGDVLNSRQLQLYAETLPSSVKAFLKAGVSIITKDIMGQFAGNVTVGTLPHIQVAEYRMKAINNAIKSPTQKGERHHRWLSLEQIAAIMATCDDSIVGQRDRVILGLGFGAGLRREEIATVTYDDIHKHGSRVALGVRGKGEKDRIVPISSVLAGILDGWRGVVGGGRIVRSLGLHNILGESIHNSAILRIVRKRGAMIGVKDLGTHDMRRSFAQIGYQAGVPLTQISKVLGHATVRTTQLYLNMDVDFDTTISDFIPL